MRSLLLSLVAVCALGSVPLHGQDTPLPKPETQDPAPAAGETPLPTPPPSELIPDDILPAPDPAAPPPTLDIPTIGELDEGLKPPPLSPAAEAHRLHVEWRKLRNRVQNEPGVKAALAKADAARTDLERRKLLARYYELFHARMIAIAPPEMKPYLLARKGEAVAALPQPRVRPETAPKPTPTPAAGVSPSGSPSPSPTPLPTSAAAYASPSPSPSPGGSSLFPRIPRS